MEVFLPHSVDEIREFLNHAGRPRDPGILCRDTAPEERKKLRASMLGVSAEGPVILAGHQPVFYPPGILVKDIFAVTMARASGGTAVNVVVDTDEEEITFTAPSRAPGMRPHRESMTLTRTGLILREQKLDAALKTRFDEMLLRYSGRLYSTFSPDIVPQVRRHLSFLRNALPDAERPMDLAVALREHWEYEAGLPMRTIYASDLVKSSAFKYFTGFIAERADDFRQSYNAVLDWYRTEHKIKNRAQPLPDLDVEKKELPFWLLKDGRRIPLTDEMLPTDGEILPRAVTLTLFLRLFLCDLFVHGRGGARYDRITDRLLADFFRCDAAPFTVASATLSVSARADIALAARSVEEIERDLRCVAFDPSRFLQKQDALRKEHDAVVARRQNPSNDRRKIHLGIQAVNEKIRAEIKDTIAELEAEHSRALVVRRNRDVYFERSYPFFFYALDPLRDAVKPYASLPALRTTLAPDRIAR